MKIVCVGRNYVAHARELGNEVPSDPVIFIKPATALSSPDTPFSIPSFSNEIHYECELVLRIAKPVRQLKKEETLSCIDAITAGIDFTARDLQQQLKEKGLPWEKAKAFDGAAVVGTWMPIDQFPNKKDIHFCLYKNRVIVQQASTAQMIFDFETLLSHISMYFTLEHGDLVFTGTPAGVGPVEPGDVLEGFVEDDSAFELSIL
ncbi:MAG: fumarylacetoacetate hydrolase family protein [Sphingomonadales bacterium]|nr:fumarylacetoacetate hydrolase family protein [Sphingomonadales bacterium]